MTRLRGWLLLAALAHCGTSWAGQGCQQTQASPAVLRSAVETAHLVRHALEERNMPAALVARVGTDLSDQGLVYSHVGVVLRDRPEGDWSIVHLLNECGSDHSSLYVEGLVNFFADDLVEPKARIIWVRADLAQTLAHNANEAHWLTLHQPHYNLLSRPDRQRSQNSTAWVLELLANALDSSAADRQRAQRWLARHHYQPDTIRIAYSKRLLGGLFASNVEFTEHSVGDRLGGHYQVSTVRSIVRFLESQGQVEGQAEWADGERMARLGPL